MDNNGSIVEFFYNIIPGSIFLFLLNYRYNFKIVETIGFKSEDAVLNIFSYIIAGLFVGFVFQAATKFVRNHLGWNGRIAKIVKNNNTNKFKDVYNKIFKRNIKDSSLISGKDTLDTFYYLDCFLRGSSPAFLPTHFSSRFAFWANIFFALIFLIIIDLFFHPISEYTVILSICAILSFYFADQYFQGFYDSIFKVYLILKMQKKD